MPSEAKVYYVDDEHHIRMAAAQSLELAGYAVEVFENPELALPRLSADFGGVVVSDIKMPRMDGLEFLNRLRALDADLPVILVTGHGDIAMAVDAMRQGAYDFIEKPFSSEQLQDVVRRAMEKRSLTMENRRLRQELEAQNLPGPRIIGRTEPLRRLLQIIGHVADTDADVLIHGETGVGKELVARSLHEMSARRSKNFVAINCGALPENLLESELFGHEPGAFTGAQGRRIGKFEHANGGTLFLDEIESMPMGPQIRLLRVLQERSLERLGSNKLIPLDLRVVAATKTDLRQAAAKGEFREDLYYRLNVVTVEIPPLRERRDDIPLLFQHFLLTAAARFGRESPQLGGQENAALLAHNWPGNVRELRNLAERWVLLGGAAGHTLSQLMGNGETPLGAGLKEQVESFERSLIEQAMEQYDGNVGEAMKVLELPRKTLYDKLKKYGLDTKSFR